MKFTAEFNVALSKLFYNLVVRDILVNAVNSTKTEFDNSLLLVADKLFGLSENISHASIATGMGKLLKSMPIKDKTNETEK